MFITKGVVIILSVNNLRGATIFVFALSSGLSEDIFQTYLKGEPGKFFCQIIFSHKNCMILDSYKIVVIPMQGLGADVSVYKDKSLINPSLDFPSVYSNDVSMYP